MDGQVCDSQTILHDDCKHIDGKATDTIRPNLTFPQAASLVQRLYGFKDVVCLQEFTAYNSQNLLIEITSPGCENSSGGTSRERLVLRITRAEDLQDFELQRQQNEILLMLKDRGLPCTWPYANLAGETLSLEKLSFFHRESGAFVTGDFLARVMCYIPGETIGGVPLLTAKMCYDAGRLLGQLLQALQNYGGDLKLLVKKGQESAWSMENVDKIRSLMHVLSNNSQKKLAQEILDAFKKNVAPNKDKFKKGLIHSDFNNYNILVRQKSCDKQQSCDKQESCDKQQSHEKQNYTDSSEMEVAGILDFDDMMYSCLVYDIAIAMMYVMQCTNLERPRVESGGIMLAGFLTEHALNSDEWEALYYCVAAHFVQSLVLETREYTRQPTNHYLIKDHDIMWDALFDLWKQESEGIYAQWRNIVQEYRN